MPLYSPQGTGWTQISRDSAVASDYLAQVKLTADTQYRLIAGLDGSSNPQLLMGPGNAVQDIYVRRSAAKTLIVDTDGVGGALTTVDFKTTNFYVNGSPISASATQVQRANGSAGDYLAEIKLTADTQYRLFTGLDGSSNPQVLMGIGGTTAPDLRLYRTGAGYLTIDPNGASSNGWLSVMGAAGYVGALGVGLIGDSVWRMTVATDNGVAFSSGAAAYDARIRRTGVGVLTLDANATGSTSPTLNLQPNLAASGSTISLFNLTNTTNASLSLQTGTGTAPSLQFGPGTGALDWSLTRTGVSIAQMGSGDTLDLHLGQLYAPAAAGIALTATEGYIGTDTTTHDHLYYDSQRQRVAGMVGWAPYAFSIGASITSAPTATATTLAASGGSVAIPVQVVGHMRLFSVSFYIGASTTPTVEYQIFRQYLNNGNAGENTLAYVTGASAATAARTASAINTIACGTAGVYLAPGLYWIVIRNTTTNTVILGGTAASTWALSMSQTKTLASTVVGSSLDFHAATWTKVTGFIIPLRFNGEVFGETAAF